ncbi:RNA polymerase subunit sigma-24 [Burkholderia sp. WAC0059]|uniref:sigma-70 family RNA polymerase sigma factor n=1 Tax=Burkholderia sp. WAC0059 TaxID=2066022 RepID=UPI000C7F2DC1|nr:sigma-70 family RNA polymerase sigma factor [Burkholderia sp. WAC0059]PLZ01931.1 RNA polymerase subunit sigma-24 [Burkholderia sp. WAC0059]
MDIREQLYEHVPRLRRYARALVSNRDLADDLVQDTLERGLSRYRQFTPGTDLRAWLFTIMHSLFVTQTRKVSARAEHVSTDDEHFVHDADLAVPAGQTHPLEIRDLDYALQRLPAEQRAVVLLVGLEEMSYAEVASALDVPVGTVMSRLSRGRERLRALMSGAPQGTKLRVVR